MKNKEKIDIHQDVSERQEKIYTIFTHINTYGYERHSSINIDDRERGREKESVDILANIYQVGRHNVLKIIEKMCLCTHTQTHTHLARKFM